MIPVEVAARGVAFAAAMLLFGASLFLVYAPMEAFQGEGDWGSDEWLRVRRAVLRMQVVGVAVGVLASVVWLVMHAATIGGEPVVRAVSSGTLVTVMRETLFGRVATLRLGLMLLLGVTLMLGEPARYAATRGIDIARAGFAGTCSRRWRGWAMRWRPPALAAGFILERTSFTCSRRRVGWGVAAARVYPPVCRGRAGSGDTAVDTTKTLFALGYALRGGVTRDRSRQRVVPRGAPRCPFLAQHMVSCC